jgi:hypothetical protein
MANYLTMALDPNAANLFKLLSFQKGNHAQRLEQLELELNRMLKAKNITIVELMKRIAIR